MVRPEGKRRRVVVIGFDGFTWKTLEYLKKDLRMPNLERLKAGSAWGRLDSTLPSNTVPAWISFATGANPGKHGVFDFVKRGETLGDISLISSGDIRTETIQQIVERNGLSSILINLHGSTPALTGDITLGSFTSASGDLFSPKELAEDPELRGYPAFAGDRISLKDKGPFIAALNEQLAARARIAKKLFAKKPDLFFLLFSESDHLQHAVYDHVKGGLRDPSVREGVLSLYRGLDDALGWFMENAGPDTYFILMSDHGFESYQYVFALNNYLERQGLLRYSKKVGRHQSAMAEKERRPDVNIKPVVSALMRHPAGRKTLDLVRDAFIWFQKKAGLARFFTVSGFVLSVDRASSKAFGTESGMIYISRKSRFSDGQLGDEEADRLRDGLLERLKNEKSPLTGRSPFGRVVAAGDLYRGPYVKYGPDIIIEPGDHGIGGVGHFGNVYSRLTRNFHDRYGIFALRGPGVVTGESRDMNIMDIAPTVLHLLGLGVPDGMDGRVMSDLLRPGETAPVRVIGAARDEARAAVQRLARSGALRKGKAH